MHWTMHILLDDTICQIAMCTSYDSLKCAFGCLKVMLSILY